MNTAHLISVILLNTPAYICAGLALWRKLHDEEYFAAVMYSILAFLFITLAVLESQILYPETCTDELLSWEAGVTVMIMPVLYMFLAPEGNDTVLNRTTIILLLLPLLLLMPEMAWELVPGYAVTQYVEPQGIMGISIFYQGQFIYHLYWAAIILTLQAFVALTQMKHLYTMVTDHGAHYSWKAKAAYYWDFSCGYFLATSYLIPIPVLQMPEYRWIYYVIADAFITIGSLLVYLGFDLNPIVVHQRKKLSLNDFMLEQGDVVEQMKHMMEDDRVYLEKGLQSDTIAQRLDISHSYFLRIVQAVYGCSFPEYINNARIEYSKQMLRENKYTLEKIASRCGYSNVNAYVHLFKRVTGLTPYEWCHVDNTNYTDESLFETAKEDAYDDD